MPSKNDTGRSASSQNQDGPVENQIRQQIKERAARKNSKTAKHAEQALVELKTLGEGGYYEQLVRWYFLMFCTCYGYAVKVEGGVRTRNSWLQPNEICHHIGNGYNKPNYLAVRPSSPVTGWAAIDIDIGSRYHPSSEDGEGIEPVLAAMRMIGLRKPLEMQSSSSGGIHLWYPLKVTVKTWELALAMRWACSSKGLEVENGIIELRPNAKNYNSDYLTIRSPMTGEGNAVWIEGIGLVDELSAFKNVWKSTSGYNCLIRSDNWKEEYLVEKRRINASAERKNGLKMAEETLAKGFTGPGQTQGIKLAALQKARLIENIDNIDDLRSRTYELIVRAPGYEEFCGHKAQISSGRLLSQAELKKTLSLAPGGYNGTWKEVANVKRADDAHARAEQGINDAIAQAITFGSEQAAIQFMKANGGPSRSWWKKPKNAAVLARLHELIKNRRLAPEEGCDPRSRIKPISLEPPRQREESDEKTVIAYCNQRAG